MTSTQPDIGTQAIWSIFDGLSVDDEWSVRFERGFEWWPHRSSQRVWADAPTAQPSGETTWLLHAEAECAEVPPDFAESMRLLDAWLSDFAQRLSMTAIHREDDQVLLHATAVVHEGNAEWVQRVFQVVVLSQARVALKAAPILSAVYGLTAAESDHPTSGQRRDPDEVLGALDNPPVGKDWSYAEFGRAADYLANAGVLATADVAGLTAEFSLDADGPAASLSGETTLLTAEAAGIDGGCQLRLTLRLPSWPRDEDGVQLFPTDLNAMEARGRSATHLIGSWAAAGEDPAAPPYFTAVLPPVLYQQGVLTNLVFAMGVRAKWISELIEAPVGIGGGIVPDLNDEGFRARFLQFLTDHLEADETGQHEGENDDDLGSSRRSEDDLLKRMPEGSQLHQATHRLAARIRQLGPSSLRFMEVSVSPKDLRMAALRDADGDAVTVTWGTRQLLPELNELASEIGVSFIIELRSDGTSGVYERGSR